MHKPPLPHRKNYTGPKIRGEYSGSGNIKRCVGEMGRLGQHGTPFITNILNDKLPTNFCPVTFQYAWLTNPCDHICRFNNKAMLQQFTKGVKCLLFATTLTRPAQQWSIQLPPNTIQTYEQLGSSFLSHFASARKQRKASLTLFSIKQRDNKPLRSYVNVSQQACWRYQPP